MDKQTRHSFRIPIGDWSNDGHGRCDWFDATATKPIKDVIKAFAAAKKKLPNEVNPENICADYGDNSPSEDVCQKLVELGAPFEKRTDDGWNYFDNDYFGQDEMAQLVVWFLHQGDPDLDVQLDGDRPPMLCDGTPHIGHIGYGLFE
jgi:hypothetical protein